MYIFQKGFNFSQDGPGNRQVYHLQGCNMRCIWCSNPEGMEAGILGVGHPENMECETREQTGILAEAKPGKCKYYTVEELTRECVRSRMMFFGGGGVTFTGGEATLQHEELKELLMALQKEQIHTAIETNGTSHRLRELLPYIDYLIMDYKHYDSRLLKRYTGIGNEGINENFAYIFASGRQIHVRIPLINGVNTENPEGFASWFAKYHPENAVFEFLPYHEYGKEKWVTEYQVENGFVSEETLEKFRAAFHKYQLKMITT